MGKPFREESETFPTEWIVNPIAEEFDELGRPRRVPHVNSILHELSPRARRLLPHRRIESERAEERYESLSQVATDRTELESPPVEGDIPVGVHQTPQEPGNHGQGGLGDPLRQGKGHLRSRFDLRKTSKARNNLGVCRRNRPEPASVALRRDGHAMIRENLARELDVLRSTIEEPEP